MTSSFPLGLADILVDLRFPKSLFHATVAVRLLVNGRSALLACSYPGPHQEASSDNPLP